MIKLILAIGEDTVCQKTPDSERIRGDIFVKNKVMSKKENTEWEMRRKWKKIAYFFRFMAANLSLTQFVTRERPL